MIWISRASQGSQRHFDPMRSWQRSSKDPTRGYHTCGLCSDCVCRCFRITNCNLGDEGAKALAVTFAGRDRKSVVWGKSVSVSVAPGGARSIKKKKKRKRY